MFRVLRAGMNGFKAGVGMGARVISLGKEISSKIEISWGLQEIFVKLFDLLNLRGISK